MAIFPDSVKKSLTPERVISRLVYLQAQAHFNHWQTKSYARHKALDTLQSELTDWKDKVAELLLGYIAPKRFSSFDTIAVKQITDEQLVAEVIDFSHELYEYGERNEWWELSNFAADIEGLGNKVKYFLTLQ